jgi:predicted DNA-binding transcriptional regulator YafY
MSAIGNVVKMLNILLRGKKVKIKDIAGELGVNERQVRRYKTELEQYFEIESSTGVDGGYLIKNYSTFYKNMLTHEELNKLMFLVNSFSPDISSDFDLIIEKLNYIIDNKKDETSSICNALVKNSIPNFKVEKMYKLTRDIEAAIIESNEILFKYTNNKGQESDRRVRPYKIINYKGENYLIAECLLKNEIRNFKLVRIKEYIQTSFKYIRSKDIEERVDEYCNNNFGIFGGEKINVELEISPPMANSIKERIWGDNQEVQEIGEGTILFKAKMTNSPEVESWILGMGNAVKIIAPIELRKSLREKLEKMLEKI